MGLPWDSPHITNQSEFKQMIGLMGARLIKEWVNSDTKLHGDTS